MQDVAKELTILFPELESFSWGDLLVTSGVQIDPVKSYTVLVKWKPGLDAIETQTKLGIFLKLRLHSENLSILNLK